MFDDFFIIDFSCSKINFVLFVKLCVFLDLKLKMNVNIGKAEKKT